MIYSFTKRSSVALSSKHRTPSSADDINDPETDISPLSLQVSSMKIPNAEMIALAPAIFSVALL
jgi:hypothetical protein